MITVLIFLGAYFAFTLLLAIAVRPYRVRLMALARELCGPGNAEEVRDLANRISIYAYSMRVAPIHALWYSTMLIKPSWQVFREAREYAQEHPAIVAEGRFDELYALYMISTAAINPAFGGLALSLRALFRLKASSYGRRRHTNPQPVITYAQLQEAA
jgi:hypothetical protein